MTQENEFRNFWYVVAVIILLIVAYGVLSGPTNKYATDQQIEQGQDERDTVEHSQFGGY